jgi:hypothetical protein
MWQTLAELQDRLQSFPTQIALQLIEEELGQPASTIVSEITPEPVAAASLGQARVSSGLLNLLLNAIKAKRDGTVIDFPDIGQVCSRTGSSGVLVCMKRPSFVLLKISQRSNDFWVSVYLLLKEHDVSCGSRLIIHSVQC